MTPNPHNRSGTPVAIVTGGANGVGRAVARKLAATDYAVVIGYLDSQSAADAAVAEILAANGIALAVRADVADVLDVERLFSETIEAFGHVDVVVHAAVRTGSVAGDDLPASDALYPVSARGTFVVNQQASLQLRDGGAIVNFSSSAAGLAPPTDAADAASEGAVAAITPIVARELSARDITVNAIALGAERAATPVDIANLVAFLVSEDGHWVNGQVMTPQAQIPGAPTRGRTGCERRREASP